MKKLLLAGVALALAVSSAPAYTTNIDGDYNGWEGDTVYKLMDGRVIQQSSFHYHYAYLYSPEVVIYSAGGCYRMRVIGDADDEDVCVTFLK
jgi:hypothetical protein